MKLRRTAMRSVTLLPTVLSVCGIFSVAISELPTSPESSRQARVVGGIEALPGRYPYQVALIDSDGYQYCGGTLIAPQWVLSAAHCYGRAYQAHIGRHDLMDASTSFDSILVDYETIHDKYDSLSNNYDFMLLHLLDKSKYAPIQLDDGTNKQMSVGTELTIMGWGATCEGSVYSHVLLETDVDVISQAQCGQSYQEEIITDQMICARRAGRDSCQGDSGGPIIFKGHDNKATSDLQVGVISWGKGCADPLYPGVYARVNEAYDWIMATVKNPNISNSKALQYQATKYIKAANRRWIKAAKAKNTSSGGLRA